MYKLKSLGNRFRCFTNSDYIHGIVPFSVKQGNWDGRLVDVVDIVAGDEGFAVAAVSGRVSNDGFVVSINEGNVPKLIERPAVLLEDAEGSEILVDKVDFVKMRGLGLEMVEFVMLVAVAEAVVKVEMVVVLKVEMHCCSSNRCYYAYPGGGKACGDPIA
ncbi:hypothetical protein SADUNF_Sadunf19G0105900 [Salix dunnii]|uniref:Uncharacterized protein n=1 Tax=Salix dunnii TaxID=1413687 RepID=A0A835J6L3_9ROSI|nr:hypothetical protein SADUNF_Sadunf19G0105900 [Salix dunnii]